MDVISNNIIDIVTGEEESFTAFLVAHVVSYLLISQVHLVSYRKRFT